MAVNLLDDLQGYWKHDETGIGNRVDSTEFGNDMEPSGLGSAPSDTTGKINNGTQFLAGGSGQGLIIPNTADLLFGDESFTISVWVSLTNDTEGSGAAFALLSGTTERSYWMNFSQNPNTWFWSVSPDGTAANQVSLESSAITFGPFYHLVGIHDADQDEIRFHVTRSDAESEIATALTAAHSGGVWDENTNDIEIGQFTATSGALVGIMDEVGVWRRALNDEELDALYNGGNALSFDNFAASSPSAMMIVM